MVLGLNPTMNTIFISLYSPGTHLLSEILLYVRTRSTHLVYTPGLHTCQQYTCSSRQAVPSRKTISDICLSVVTRTMSLLDTEW